MLILNLIAAFGALGGVDAYLVTPAGTAFPGANSDCSEWVSGSSGLTCEEIYAEYNINQALFYYFVSVNFDRSHSILSSGTRLTLTIEPRASTAVQYNV